MGGVISPLLANLFLHYAFDAWMRRTMPGVPFERYADDIICHCRTEREALALRQMLDRRFGECGLALHPEKTKLVYCKDTNRKADHAAIQFDFLGYTFRPRLAKWRGGLFGVSFLPAASPTALKSIRQVIRGWSLQTRSDKALDDLARMFNPYIRGWINYYSPQRSPHCATASFGMRTPALDMASANVLISGASLCSGMVGMRS